VIFTFHGSNYVLPCKEVFPGLGQQVTSFGENMSQKHHKWSRTGNF